MYENTIMYCSKSIFGNDIGKKLLTLRDSPDELFTLGNVDLLQDRKVLGIVGSRNISSYGERVLKTFFETLNSYDICTVSGFMTGVDYNCHALSIKNSIPTIAMLPCGLDTPYPYSHISLKDEIVAAGGLVCSEYPALYCPKKWTFVKRNRLIAGVCDALLIIEAGIKSGSLVTARIALSYAKPVFVIPGDIFRDNMAGNFQLLKEGAHLLTNIKDLVTTMDFKYRSANATYSCSNIAPLQNALSTELVKFLTQNSPSTLDMISQQLHISSVEITTELAFLEISGLVIYKGGYYSVC